MDTELTLVKLERSRVMNAKKLNLTNYQIKITDPLTFACLNCGKPATEPQSKEFNVREAIANIITNPQQKHKGFRQITFDDLARRIVACKDDYIILDKVDFDMLYECFDNLTGYSRNDVELLRRVRDAEEVELEEKSKK